MVSEGRLTPHSIASNGLRHHATKTPHPAPDAWRRRVRSVTAQGSEEAAGAVANGGPVTQLEEDGGSVTAADAGELAADATPSPPVTRSAMRAAAAAAAQLRASTG